MTTLFGVTLPQRRGFSVPIQVIAHRGITAWLVEERSVPVVSLAWGWPGGATLDAPGQEGTANLAAALLTEGAGPLRAVAFGDALRDAAINLGFSANREAFEGGLRALTDALPEAARLARLAMTEPRLDADAVDRIRARAVAGARQQLETPSGLARRAFWAAAFPEHPAGRLPTPESLAAARPEAMRALLSRQMRRDGLLVTASGAIGRDELVALLDQLFGELPAGAPPAPPALPPLADFGRTIAEKAAPQSAMLFAQDGPPPTDPDWEAFQVAIRILSGGDFSSRLTRRVREERGLTYGIGAGLDPLFGRSIVVGSVATENANVGEVWNLIRTAWTEMAEAGPTAEEVANAVAFLSGSLPLQFTDSRRTASLLLGLRQVGRTPEWLAGRPARLAALTRDGVAAACRRLLRPDGLALAVAGQPAGL
ncbi:MAG: insulinase family protein [Acetobacteraceae bacterium]|nr:insulinase family protein [Acetobacteraceae bacterium]